MSPLRTQWPNLEDAEILVRGVNWLGDAVMSIPALVRLKERWPNARVTLHSPEAFAPIWRRQSSVDAVLPFSKTDSARDQTDALREGRFSLALILPNSFRSAFPAWRAGIPRRLGYSGQWRRWLLTDPVAPGKESIPMRKPSPREIRRRLATRSRRTTPSNAAHHLHQYLRLAGALGAETRPVRPSLTAPAEEREETLAKFGWAFDPSRPICGLNPGAEYGPAKRWPADRFVRSAADVHRQTGARWLVFGGPRDRELAASITRGLETELKRTPGSSDPKGAPVMDLAGKTSLSELCALLAACRLVLTNDTGPMHLAAALGTPVVALFGSTAPELTGPGLPDALGHAVIAGEAGCAPCFLRECPIDLRCLRDGVQVEAVTAAVRDRLRP